eukprot:TRINITY_DN27282_c0_g1_i1.p1 TRINITY_DN27282_c0_g1~~TRINITY_DN27282_c0_g1_i1.p1  ORF type:complete len:372 (+),score=65.68 TRINITY_DN27282_c0_g1_i1:74-1189(+)
MKPRLAKSLICWLALQLLLSSNIASVVATRLLQDQSEKQRFQFERVGGGSLGEVEVDFDVPLGSGNMAEAFQATIDGKAVVAKFTLQPSGEFEILRKLQQTKQAGDGIIEVYGQGVAEGRRKPHFVVEEFVQGETLASLDGKVVERVTKEWASTYLLTMVSMAKAGLYSKDDHSNNWMVDKHTNNLKCVDYGSLVSTPFQNLGWDMDDNQNPVLIESLKAAATPYMSSQLDALQQHLRGMDTATRIMQKNIIGDKEQGKQEIRGIFGACADESGEDESGSFLQFRCSGDPNLDTHPAMNERLDELVMEKTTMYNGAEVGLMMPDVVTFRWDKAGLQKAFRLAQKMEVTDLPPSLLEGLHRGYGTDAKRKKV